MLKWMIMWQWLICMIGIHLSLSHHPLSLPSLSTQLCTGSSPECATTLHNKCDVRYPSARHRCSWHRSFTTTTSISTSFPLFPIFIHPLYDAMSAVKECKEISKEYENLCLDQHQVPMRPQSMPSSTSRPPLTSSWHDMAWCIKLCFAYLSRPIAHRTTIINRFTYEQS